MGCSTAQWQWEPNFQGSEDSGTLPISQRALKIAASKPCSSETDKHWTDTKRGQTVVSARVWEIKSRAQMGDRVRKRDRGIDKEKKREGVREAKNGSRNLILQNNVPFFTRSLPPQPTPPPLCSLPLSRPRYCFAAFQADLHTEHWKREWREAGRWDWTVHSGRAGRALHFCSRAVSSVSSHWSYQKKAHSSFSSLLGDCFCVNTAASRLDIGPLPFF